MTRDRDAAPVGVTRYPAIVRVWEDGRTPEDGEPDTIKERFWFEEPDGTVITDPARIKELEAAYEQNMEG